MENVFITPHIAGLTERMWERHYAHYTENLRRYLAGEPLLWVVDKQRVGIDRSKSVASRLVLRRLSWCRRRDSNPHTLAGTWT